MATRTLDRNVVTLTIWDNLERHKGELRALGATDADFASLEAAAQAVHEAEQADAQEGNQDRLQEILQPTEVPALDITIAPPTPAARHWAGLSVAQALGGKTGQVGEVPHHHAVVAGLCALWAYGQGKKATVMRTAEDANAVADLVGSCLARKEAAGAWDAREELEDTYLRLMGLDPVAVKKKAMATAAYLSAVLILTQRLRSPNTPPSST